MENFACQPKMLKSALKYRLVKSYPYKSPLLWSRIYIELSVISTTRLYIERLYCNKGCNEVLSSELDITRTVHIIVHGQSYLLNKAQEELALKGFDRARMQKATLGKAGEIGDYVAMAWPPMDPK